MCGRFTQYSGIEYDAEYLGAELREQGGFVPLYNSALSQSVWVNDVCCST